MKRIHTFKFSLLVLLFGFFVFANNSINERYGFSIADLFSREQVVPTDLKPFAIDPSQAAKSILLDDFEGSSNWTMINSKSNAWYIGEAIANGGKQSLYISNDQGKSNEYSNSTKSFDTSFAVSSVFTIPAGSQSYVLSFDWRNNGEINRFNDDISIWVVPSDYVPVADTKMSAIDSKGLLLKDQLAHRIAFKKENVNVDLSAFSGQSVKLAIQWLNNNFSTVQPPAAIDNLVLYPFTCEEPSGLKVNTLTQTSATLEWDMLGASTDYEVILTSDASYPINSATAVEVKQSNTYTYTNLKPSTYYYAWHRTVCSSTDKSYWVGPVKFMTVCGELGIPFEETFNTTSMTFECWSFNDANNDATAPNGSNLFRFNTNSPHEGDRHIYFQGDSNISRHDDWLISPTFKLENKAYKLTYFYRTSSSNNNEFEVLLSTNGTDLTEFKTELVPARSVQVNEYIEKTVYISGISGEINLAWHIVASGAITLYLDKIDLVEVACAEPIELQIDNIDNQGAEINWTDTVNSQWEYAVLPAFTGLPQTKGIAVNQPHVKATTDINGATFIPGAMYSYYVRSVCANGIYSDWIGPVDFKYTCTALTLPFVESFDSASITAACWRVIDANTDVFGVKPISNLWQPTTSGTNSGNGGYVYKGSATSHDDWLISPALAMNGGMYQITFYVKGAIQNNNELEIKYSTTGSGASQFVDVIMPATKILNAAYTKKVVYISGVTGDVNIGWHATGIARSTLFIDDISIEEVSCIAPDDSVVINNVGKQSATFTWTDDTNAEWDYYIMPAHTGLQPQGSGTRVNTKTVNATMQNTQGGVNLVPNTDYEFYVRSSCGVGKTSSWVGPYLFRTLCEVQPFPYAQGFESDDPTLGCWRIVDNNNDANKQNNAGTWAPVSSDKYEGTWSMSFTNSSSANNDDWLISPTFSFVANKVYRVTYYYKPTSAIDNEMEVMLSTQGVDVANFTTEVVKKAIYKNTVWAQEKVFITGITGDVTLGFHIVSKVTNSRINIDSFKVEEVENCVEPIDLGVNSVLGNQVTLTWNDNFGATDWEYFVRRVGVTKLPPSTNGTAVSANSATVSVENNGTPIKGNTEYEYFVRTSCGGGKYSIWSGPYKFRTLCTTYTIPFREGFNGLLDTMPCWTILDENKDATTPTGNGIWKQVTTGQFEGSHGVMFGQTSTVESDDWLISPILELQPNKTYRIKFHYKATAATPNEMEIVASNSGTDPKEFKHIISSSAVYASETYKEEIHYLTGLSGSVNIAWHLIGAGKKNIYIDNVFFDEVTTCPQPINAIADQIETNKATLIWEDDFGATEWEYIVQNKGKGAPSATDKGVTTTNKQNVVTADYAGNPLEFNTDYEYYVRTTCKDGGESIWTGPIYFTTICGVYQAPYKEGFNKKTVGYRCWTILDENKDSAKWDLSIQSPYEGDQAMSFTHTRTTQADDWLISPMIELDGGMYALKYHYRTNVKDQNVFEVKLSVDGTAPADFKQELLKAKTYANTTYKEETIFISGVRGKVNIGWHAITTGSMFLAIDNISITKVVGCPEPYEIKVSNSTNTTLDIEWKQDGGITEWEVLAVEYGNPIPAGQNGVQVNGASKTTITGLKEGTAYQIYVRAICANNSGKSEWSSPSDGSTLVSGNNTCANPITIPVNPGVDCITSVAGSTVGASKISVAQPECFGGTTEVDVWFEFTATSDMHEFSISNLRGVSDVKIPTVQFAIYQADCTNLTVPTRCYQIENVSGNETRHDMKKIFKDLIPGQKYLIQLALPSGGYLFNLCLTTSENGYVSVSYQGDKYTTDELIKDILINAPCDLVSNVKYQSAGKDGGNTFGYFNQNNSLFPFKEGIVLTTHDIRYVPGPYDFDYYSSRGKVNAWEGDQDLNDVITNVGGAGFGSEKFVSTVEFDFIPINDAVRFEYLFTSQSYIHDCKWVCKPGGALFAAWLTEIETGEGLNLAVVPGTREPIALSTIRDVEKSGAACESVYPEFYGNHYGNGIDDPLLAPINYIGMTKPMSSDLVKVKPGVKYRIKLAVADFCDWRSHTTAVFFNAQSFDIGSIKLGDDLTIENGTAVCAGESKTIRSGMPTENVKLAWYKDNVLIPNETSPDLVVTEAGVYKLQAEFELLKDCVIEGEILVEMYPPLSDLVESPVDLEMCRFWNGTQSIDLTVVESAMFAKVESVDYSVTYFETIEDLESNSNAIGTPTDFVLEQQDTSKRIYILVNDLLTGCSIVFDFDINFVAGSQPQARENIAVCESYTLPELEANQMYYTGAGASGNVLSAGDILYTPGVYQLYVYQDNENGCYEEVSFEVSITEKEYADVLEDVEMLCDVFVLPELSSNNRYFTGSLKQGTELFAGMELYQSQRIYIYTESADGLCTDESSFMLTYAECPIPKGISPNGDGVNDSFDLRFHGVESLKIFNRLGVEVYSHGSGYVDQWHGQDKGGKSLVSGTYYYVIISHGKTKTGWVQINK